MSNTDFVNNLMNFFSKTIIKNSAMANEYETVSSKEKSRMYISAYNKVDDFNTYKDLYTREDLLMVGVPFASVDSYLINLDILPENIKSSLLLRKRDMVINAYNEENQYYRMLNGQPPLGITPYKIKGKYVTELTLEEVVYIYKKELDELKEKHTKLSDRYLYYLGENKVDFYTARVANDLEIIYYNNYIFDTYITRKIIEMYYETAAYFQNIFYSKAFEKHQRYSHFLIISIVFSTINKILSEPIRLSIRGEFNDIEVLRDIFLGYNLPFDPLIPKRYLQRIVKNINSLFSYKGTNQVLIDIVSLFGYDKISLNKYYLIKELKKDKNGNFIFNGSNEEKFELNFIEVPITDVEDNSLFTGEIKRVDYNVITNSDPFWGGAEKIRTKQKLLESDFNYCNTKYLAINTMTNITKILQETCYFFNFINSAEEEKYLDKLQLVDSDIKESVLPIKLFDLIVAMNILICKRLGYEDLIIYAGTGISSLYGFNFKGNKEHMESILNKYPDFASKTKYGQVRSLFKNAPYTKADLIEIFFNNLDYKQDLENAMVKCNNKKEYDMLCEIYKYNCYSEAVHSIFYSEEKKKYYRKYSEYLIDNDIELYRFVEKYIKIQDYETALRKLFDAADLYLEDVRLTSMFLNSSITDRLQKYIFSLLAYFKAYTVDINTFNIFYLVDDAFVNNVKLIDEIVSKIKDVEYADVVFLNYYEQLIINQDIDCSDKLVSELADLLTMYISDIIQDTNLLLDDSRENYKSIIKSSYNEIYDIIVAKARHRKDEFILNEYGTKEINKEDLMGDICDIIKTFSTIMYAESLLVTDTIKEVIKYRGDSLSLQDSILNNEKQKNIEIIKF